MAAVELFGAQIAAQTRNIFAMWKLVPISNINHYHETHFYFGVFHILFSFWTFVIIWENLFVQIKIVLDNVGRMNHCWDDWDLGD